MNNSNTFTNPHPDQVGQFDYRRSIPEVPGIEISTTHDGFIFLAQDCVGADASTILIHPRDAATVAKWIKEAAKQLKAS